MEIGNSLSSGAPLGFFSLWLSAWDVPSAQIKPILKHGKMSTINRWLQLSSQKLLSPLTSQSPEPVNFLIIYII